MPDIYLNLDQQAHKIVIRDLYDHILHKSVTLEEIVISNEDCTVVIKGQPILRWDRHLHYPTAENHPIAAYLFLRAIEDIILSKKEITH